MNQFQLINVFFIATTLLAGSISYGYRVIVHNNMGKSINVYVGTGRDILGFIKPSSHFVLTDIPDQGSKSEDHTGANGVRPDKIKVYDASDTNLQQPILESEDSTIQHLKKSYVTANQDIYIYPTKITISYSIPAGKGASLTNGNSSGSLTVCDPCKTFNTGGGQ
jgi:hypothetical protein